MISCMSINWWTGYQRSEILPGTLDSCNGLKFRKIIVRETETVHFVNTARLKCFIVGLEGQSPKLQWSDCLLFLCNCIVGYSQLAGKISVEPLVLTVNYERFILSMGKKSFSWRYKTSRF